MAALITLSLYAVVMLTIGLWAARRSREGAAYLLADRGLGPWVAGLSASASSSSAWTLLGVSGAAYHWGLSAVWLLPATLGGFLLNWFVIAPRLQRLSRAEQALTLTAVVAAPSLGVARNLVARLIAVITLFCFVFYIASQFEGAAAAFAVYFEVDRLYGLLLGAALVMAYTVLGGFWAASVSDMLQGLTMLIAAITLPVVAIVAAGGVDALYVALSQSFVGIDGAWTQGLGIVGSIGFIAGTLGIGLGYPGQPHVVNRFMALVDITALRRARVIAITWAIIIYCGMLLVGWSARVLLDGNLDGDTVLFALTADLLPGAIAGVMLAAVLSAIMSTADSQLLVAGAAVSHDWPLGSERGESRATRPVVATLCLLAVALAWWVPDDIFSRVLFAWHALGSSLGPILVVRLAGFEVKAKATIAAISCGFLGTVGLSLLPAPPGDWLERLLPLLLSLAIAWQGRYLIERQAGPAS